VIKTANLTGSVSRNAGGLYESVRRLVQSLMREGVDVRVMGVTDEFTAEDAAAWSPAQVMAFKPVWPEEFGFSTEFLSNLLDYRPDLTHTHGIWRYTSAATNNYCRAMGTPYIVSPHGMLDPWALRNSRWKKVFAHALYEGAHLRGATCLRALCESEAHSFRQAGLKNPVCVIPNGIDLPEGRRQKAEARMENAENLKTETLKPAGVDVPSSNFQLPSSQRKTLLYLGRIHPKKGLVNLIKAWAEIRKPDWLLEIAGWDQGGHERELKILSMGQGVQESVRFLGPQFGEDKAARYRNCDAFILPSFSEGLPMVALEAWAHGKPVLMTPECNLPEGFAAGAALRIEANPESIARGLQTLFEMSAEERGQMGGRGLQLVSARFSWSVVAKELKQVYEWMLGGGTKPASIYAG
jgi:poly(glycerol-phosphate) alpha-glucosyltransferase